MTLFVIKKAGVGSIAGMTGLGRCGAKDLGLFADCAAKKEAVPARAKRKSEYLNPKSETISKD